jgi:Trk K+ transport system NAD-binding subunit
MVAGPGSDKGCYGTYRDGRIELDGDVSWPAGAKVRVHPVEAEDVRVAARDGRVVVAGFGLAGRGVAELLDKSKIEYTIIERNVDTIATQGRLGRAVVCGDVSDASVLVAAGVPDASVIALTVPDEDAVLKAIAISRRLNPRIYIVARTMYASRGIEARRLGADDVIKSEQAVAIQFFELLRARMALGVEPWPGGE